MYRRPKFLEVLLDIRQEMARCADYDVDLFAELVRTGSFPDSLRARSISEPPTHESESRDRNARKRSK